MGKKYLKEDELNLSIDDFVVRCHDLIPATYGKMMVKKIVSDSRGKMTIVDDSVQRGDSRIQHDSYYEIKTSYLNKGGRFSIRNIRSWQKFNYFILCLIDTSGDKYKPYFYCVPKEVITNSPVLTLTGQNNTKESNDKNEEVGQSTTFDSKDHSWLFKKKNLLGGTSYNDLMNYINKKHGGPYIKTVEPKKVIVRGEIRKIYLSMKTSIEEIIINGRNNKEVMTNLVKYIGPKKLDGIMWKSWLNKLESKDRNVNVGGGYYFNPKFSLRDITTIINQINIKLNLSFNIIKK